MSHPRAATHHQPCQPKPAATTKPVSRAPEKPAREETVRDSETPAVGDGGIVLRGVVLRRTINGWFGASPPADEHITAVRASSPSTATVTLEDGRVFNTENGGVTWSTP